MLALPESMRGEARKPFGKIFKGSSALAACRKAARPLITVGDQCAYDLVTAGIVPDMLIVDFKIKRVEIPPEMKRGLAKHAKSAFVVLSPPGKISDELEKAVATLLLEGSGAIIVIGEDDLSSLLVMANAKAGTLVYGQPNEGAVLVPLGGKEVREKAQGMLGRMEQE